MPVLPPPSDSPFDLANAPQGADRLAQALVTAMIAAAKADGHVDAEEQKNILGKLSENGLDPDEVAFLTQELTAPLDIDKVVKGATNKEEAVEIYAASLIAITADHPAERAYLDMLAARLGIEHELARAIEIISEQLGLNIVSLLVPSARPGEPRAAIINLATIDPREALTALQDAGFEVGWPALENDLRAPVPR